MRKASNPNTDALAAARKGGRKLGGAGAAPAPTSASPRRPSATGARGGAAAAAGPGRKIGAPSTRPKPTSPAQRRPSTKATPMTKKTEKPAPAAAPEPTPEPTPEPETKAAPAPPSEPPISVVVFGASGDLAKKKTYPALFHLFADGWIAQGTVFYGFARSPYENDKFRERLRPFLEKEAGKRGTEQKINAFLESCVYVDGQYNSPEGFQKLTEVMEKDEKERGGTPGRLFYLALPPTVFPDVCKQIKDCCMIEGGPWNRVVVEKPFGRDLESSEELAEKLAALFTEDELYRIDHYLGKELVQNLMALRFTNQMFANIWDRDHIANVQISFKEPFGTEGRGGYFDKSGIIRDILQNHLLQVMSIVAMEPPKDNSPEAIRDEKTSVLNQTHEITLDDVVVGQYEGNSDNPSYLDDEGVPKDSVTPTFATCVLHVDNLRWKDVPFVLKAGKALNERKAEIRIQFKTAENCPSQPDPPRNELVIRLQPSEAIYWKVNAKQPGLGNNILETELDLTYTERYTDVLIPDAYERLILDVIRGDHQHFVRRDELVAAWKIFTPILHKLENDKIKPLPYEFGGRGPKESDELISKCGYKRSSNYRWRVTDRMKAKGEDGVASLKIRTPSHQEYALEVLASQTIGYLGKALARLLSLDPSTVSLSHAGSPLSDESSVHDIVTHGSASLAAPSGDYSIAVENYQKFDTLGFGAENRETHLEEVKQVEEDHETLKGEVVTCEGTEFSLTLLGSKPISDIFEAYAEFKKVKAADVSAKDGATALDKGMQTSKAARLTDVKFCVNGAEEDVVFSFKAFDGFGFLGPHQRSNKDKHMSEIVLVGDIGGTNSRLRLYRIPKGVEAENNVVPGTQLYMKKYRNENMPTFGDVVRQFFKDFEDDTSETLEQPPRVACFAVAGPVDSNSVSFTNRASWVIDGNLLAKELSIQSVQLVNDFVANGYGLLTLQKNEIYPLTTAKPKPGAPIALLGAGTGLGECFLSTSKKDPTLYDCWPSEGGHTEFAPRTDVEIELLQYLKAKFGESARVSVERICSGKGISNVYEFLRNHKDYKDKVDPKYDAEWEKAGDLQGKAVSDAAKAGDTLSSLAMDIFFSTYGSEAGAVGLKYLCFGGLYIAGGIAPLFADRMKGDGDSPFLHAFKDKGRVSGVLDQIPMSIVLAEDIGQRGAHLLAFRDLRDLTNHV